VPHVRTIDVLACPHGFFAASKKKRPSHRRQCIQLTRQTQRNEKTETASRVWGDKRWEWCPQRGLHTGTRIASHSRSMSGCSSR